jgi:hypothetical protein
MARNKLTNFAVFVLSASFLIGCSDGILSLLQEDVNRYVNNLVSLTIVSVDHGTTIPSGTVDIPASRAYSIQAVADSGYQFSGWETVSGTPVFGNSSLASTTITLVDGNATIRPRFDVWAVGGVTFNPIPGTYQSAQNVSLAPVTAGATIRYTLDGSVPTESTGIAYSTPINFPLNSGPTTLTAVAFKVGMTPSDPTIGVYRITGTVATPTFSPSSVNPSTSFSVSLSSATSGATIRYTTDGSTPTTSYGTLYSSAIPVSITTTIRAIAYKADWANSSVASATYTIAWVKSYGTTGSDIGYGIVPYGGSWYLASKSGTSRRLSKIGPDGTLAWTRGYLQVPLDGGIPAAAGTNGVLTIGGSYFEDYKFFTRAALLDGNGNIVWNRKYSPASFSEFVGWFRFHAAVQLPDGSFAIAASDDNDGRAQPYVDLLSIGSDGAALAGYYVGGLGIGRVDAFAVAKSGSSVNGYLLVVTPQGTTNIQLVALTSAKAFSWSRLIAGGSDDRTYGATARTTGEYLVVGASNTTVPMQSSYDALLIHASSTGTITYTSYGDTNYDDEFRSVAVTSDGGYIVAGATKSSSSGAGGFDAWVVKFSSANIIEWSKTYGGVSDDKAHAIASSGDGGYLVCGETSSYGSGGDSWVLKLDSQGNPYKNVAGTKLGLNYTPYNNGNQSFIVTDKTYTIYSHSQFTSESESISSSSVTWTTNTQYP